MIAVDAGHGGIDTGAIGSETKIEEKSVTLAFATQLVETLNKENGVKAFLTRDKDEFLSLPERVQVARQHSANLFISIHADTLKQRDIRGATVYTISDKASDHLAANLAARENLSDEIAGVTFKSEPAEVADILIDLTRRETQAFSVNLARSVVSSFEGQINLINNPHRHAGFRACCRRRMCRQSCWNWAFYPTRKMKSSSSIRSGAPRLPVLSPLQCAAIVARPWQTAANHGLDGASSTTDRWREPVLRLL